MSQSESDNSISSTTARILSQKFQDLADLCSQPNATFGTLSNNLAHRRHAMLTLFLALPFMQPVPVPGLSVLFGAGIVTAGVGMVTNRRPWFPQLLLRRKLPARLLRPVFMSCAKLMSKLERFIKPRGIFMQRHTWGRIVNGVIISLCGFLLALPLPPGTNFPPACTVVFLSIAVLEEDGVFMALGYFAFALNCAIFTVIGLFGVDALRALIP